MPTVAGPAVDKVYVLVDGAAVASTFFWEGYVDLSKFKTSDWLKVGGGAVFFVAAFLTWWKVEFEGFEGFGGVSEGATGLSDYVGTVGLAWLIFTAIAVLTVLAVLGKFSLPSNIPAPLVFLGASVFGLLLVLLRFLADGIDGGDLDGTGISISRGIGAYLGFLAAIAVVVGCVLGFKESGGDLNDLKDVNKLKGSFGGMSRGSTPPPPPTPASMTPPPPPPAPGGMAPPPPPPGA